MGREAAFTEILEEIKKKARTGENFITCAEIEEAFSALSLTPAPSAHELVPPLSLWLVQVTPGT